MRKTAKRLLQEHDSYIDALKAAIDRWERADIEAEKVDYMLAIGEIGREIHRMNNRLDIAHMDTSWDTAQGGGAPAC